MATAAALSIEAGSSNGEHGLAIHGDPPESPSIIDSTIFRQQDIQQLYYLAQPAVEESSSIAVSEIDAASVNMVNSVELADLLLEVRLTAVESVE